MIWIGVIATALVGFAWLKIRRNRKASEGSQ